MAGHRSFCSRPTHQSEHAWGGAKRVYLIGSIHGNETQGLTGLNALVSHLHDSSDVTVRVIEDMNPDGTSGSTRTNAHHVDLNRNWPAHNFMGSRQRGPSPLSEPETRVVQADLERFAPDLVVVLHSTPSGPFVNFDGPGEAYARAFVSAAREHDERWRVKPEMGYATPGSLGTLVGIDWGVAILTIEFDRPSWAPRAGRVLRDGVDAAIRRLQLEHRAEEQQRNDQYEGEDVRPRGDAAG